MTETLRDAVKKLRDEWREDVAAYAVASSGARDIGRAMAQDARSSMCVDHADRLTALLDAHQAEPALAPRDKRPPADAKEWACPDCGVDVLWYRHRDGCTYEAIGSASAEPARETIAATPPTPMEFFDFATGRMMQYVSPDAPFWAGWLFYKHPDGQWVSLRKATEEDVARIAALQAPATPPTWEEIRALPSPWRFNDVSRMGDSSEWRYGCDWCGATLSVVKPEFKHPDDEPLHPQNGCLYARAHTPVIHGRTER